MKYKIGDTVVHWNYGIGSVVGIEEVNISGEIKSCYVVKTELLQLWAPVDEAENGSLRLPMDCQEFTKLFDILRTPGQPLPDRPFERKSFLRNLMQKKTLEGLCQIIRDLTDRSRKHSLSWEDEATLNSAQKRLIDEWVIVMGTDRSEAVTELEALLQ